MKQNGVIKFIIAVISTVAVTIVSNVVYELIIAGVDAGIDAANRGDEHSHNMLFEEAKLPTCTEAGWEEYYYCDSCDYTEGFVQLDPTFEHQFGEWYTINDATCLMDGLEMRVCECGEQLSNTIPAFGSHDYFNRVCSRCEDVSEYSVGLEFSPITTLYGNVEAYMFAGMGDCVDTEVVIPPEYEGLPVTAIGDFVLRGTGCNVESVWIPSSVVEIEQSAFADADSLQQVIFDDCEGWSCEIWEFVSENEYAEPFWRFVSERAVDSDELLDPYEAKELLMMRYIKMYK